MVAGEFGMSSAGGKSTENYVDEFTHLTEFSDMIICSERVIHQTGAILPQPPELFLAKLYNNAEIEHCKTELETFYIEREGPILKGHRKYNSQIKFYDCNMLSDENITELKMEHGVSILIPIVESFLGKLSQYVDVPDVMYKDIETVKTNVTLENGEYNKDEHSISNFECDAKMTIKLEDGEEILISNKYYEKLQMMPNPQTGQFMPTVIPTSDNGITIELKKKDGSIETVETELISGSNTFYAQLVNTLLVTPYVSTEKPALKLNGKPVKMREYVGDLLNKYINTHRDELDREVMNLVSKVDNPLYAEHLITEQQKLYELEGMGKVYNEYVALFKPATKEIIDKAYNVLQKVGEQIMQNMSKTNSEGTSNSEKIHKTIGTI